MGFAYFGKKTGLNRTKDLIVALVCIFLYLMFFTFILTPPGRAFLDFFKNNIPFMELIDDTLGDINKLFGLIFEKIGLGASVNTVSDEIAGLSFVSLFFDLSKLMLSTGIQSFIFYGFSILFLHAKNSSLVDIFFGERDINVNGLPSDIAQNTLFKFHKKKDILYWFNHLLLMGISILLGGFAGSTLIYFAESSVLSFDAEKQFWLSLIIFLLIYILFSILFMIRTIKSSGITYSLRRSFVKTLLFNLLPESLAFFVTNIITVVMFNCFILKGFHILSILAFLVFILWGWLSDKIAELLGKLFFSNLPYMGKYCPISNILWAPATASVVLLIYFMTLPNMDANSNVLEQTIVSFPFINEWAMGAPVFDLVITNLDIYATPLLNLLVLCTVASAIQYLSSSYFATLFTQVFVRIFTLGFFFLIVIFTYMFLTLGVQPAVDTITYINLAAIVAVLLYFLFAVYQPFLALQGIISTILVILTMQWFPGTMFFYSTASNSSLGSYLGGTMIMIGLSLLLALVQNIVAFIEKKVNKVTKVLTK